MGKKHQYYSKTSLYDEAIRTLRTNIQFGEVDRRLKTLVITSSLPSEGKSTIAVQLARSFALNGEKCLLVDCDLRNPSIGKRTGVETNVGLTNILTKKVTSEKATVKDSHMENLDLILCGVIPPNPAELLGSRAMKEFLKEVEDRYDYIILDTPPVGILTDAAVLSVAADGVILIVNQGETKRDDIQVAINKIEHVGGYIIGAVLNKVKLESKRDYKSYYGYY